MFGSLRSASRQSANNLSRTDSLRTDDVDLSKPRRSIFGGSRRELSTAVPAIPEGSVSLVQSPTGHIHTALTGQQHGSNRSPLAVHTPPLAPPSLPIDADVSAWIAAIDEAAPEAHVMRPPQTLPEAPELPIGSISINHVRDEYSGKLFLRIFSTKLYWTDRPYKLNLRLGQQHLSSCGSKESKSINDWFLLDLAQAEGELVGNSSKSYLNVVPNVANLTIQLVVSVANTIQQKKKGFFAGALQRVRSRSAKASDGMSIASGSETCTNEGQSVASLTIPLVLLAIDELQQAKSLPASPRSGNEERFTALMALAGRASTSGLFGTFYLIDPATQEAAGEITLHAMSTPNSFVISRALGRTVQEARFQGPLTFLRPARTQYWQRVWGVVLGNELLLYDFQRHDRPQDWVIPLARVVKIDFLVSGSQSVTVENLIEIWLEEGVNLAGDTSKAYIPLQSSSPTSIPSNVGPTKLLAYADTADSASQWVNNISMAIWGQPYNSSY